jgi:hypothetical protein
MPLKRPRQSHDEMSVLTTGFTKAEASGRHGDGVERLLLRYDEARIQQSLDRRLPGRRSRSEERLVDVDSGARIHAEGSVRASWRRRMLPWQLAIHFATPTWLWRWLSGGFSGEAAVGVGFGRHRAL